MKKIFLYSLLAVSSLSLNSCKDDDTVSDSDRMFMTMFRCDNNTGKGSDDPYNCAVVDLNDIHLYWYGVNDCAGYEIKWALQPNVSNGEDAWLKAEADGKLVGDTIVGPNTLDILLKDFGYQTDYRFAIRTLSPKGEGYHSKWYGYGNGRQWAEYLGLQTAARYDVPSIIQASDITKTSMRINLNRKSVDYSSEQIDGFKEHFTLLPDGNFKVDYLTVKPSVSSPDAAVPARYEKYQLTAEDWERGYVDVEGLTENSVYNIDVVDADIPVAVDATFNSLMKRTKGDPGAPILVKHEVTRIDTIGDYTYDISSYNAMKLDNIINDYCSSNALAENQTFYLEGGKAYFISGGVSLYKGLTLATNPEDLAAGKGRAKFYLSGMTKLNGVTNTCNFMLGRQPQSGENSTIAIDIDTVRFKDLIVDVPEAQNYGTNGGKSGNGNYFMNMYSNGMGINVTELAWEGCEFHGLIRGFFRIQGSNDFNIANLSILDCDFFNDGYYDNKGAGYQWIFADHGSKVKSNILNNVKIENCTFFNAPHGSLISDNKKKNTWDASVRWNISVKNNTFVNFQCLNKGNDLLYLGYIPGGSVITVQNNLFVLTKDAADSNRPLAMKGYYTLGTLGGDGSGSVTYDVKNNWSTNDNLTKGSIFSADAFTGSANGMLKNSKIDKYVNDQDELNIHVDNITAAELFVDPNIHNYIGETPSALDYYTKCIDGSVAGGNNLYFQTTEKVRNSNIYTKNVGAAKWRNGAATRFFLRRR